MHDLQLVGVHDDGEHLVLTGGDGQRYRVRIDEPLRAAVRRDRARLGQLQIEMGGTLRPRDIQARIRAGESAEDVAASSGLPLEHVRRYEGPVLAERSHVADLARRLPARQVSHRPPFADLVAERLAARGVDTGSAAWDAWRRDDSTWTVQLAFRAGTKDRTAQWAYDVQRSHLEPLDDEARWLSASTAAEEGPGSSRRLAAVSERVYDVEADGGVRPAAGEATAGGTHTLDLLDALRGRRGRRQPLVVEDDGAEQGPQPVETESPDAADPRAVPDEELPPPAHPPASRPEEASDADVLALPEVEEADAATDAAEADVDATDTDATDTDATDAEPRRAEARGRRAQGAARSSSRNRRASVPSWDEIVFGAKRE